MSAPDFDRPNGVHPAGRNAWLRWALLCDEVRVEDTGKRLYIGGYSQALTINSRPAILSLRMCGAFEFVTSGAHRLEFRVTTPHGQGLGTMESLPDCDPGTYGEFDVPVMDFISEPGFIELDWRVDGGEWGPAMQWRINVAEDATVMPDDAAAAMEAYWNTNYGGKRLEGDAALGATVGRIQALLGPPVPPTAPKKSRKKR